MVKAALKSRSTSSKYVLSGKKLIEYSSLSIVIIEDDDLMAKGLIQRLRERVVFPCNYVILSSYEEFEAAIGTYLKGKLAYIVDVNLDDSANDESGIRAIEEIKKKEQDSLAVVYTAHPSKKDNCLSAGADYFYVKAGSSRRKERLDKIAEKCNEYFSRILQESGKVRWTVRNIMVVENIIDEDVFLDVFYEDGTTGVEILEFDSFHHVPRLKEGMTFEVYVIDFPNGHRIRAINQISNDEAKTKLARVESELSNDAQNIEDLFSSDLFRDKKLEEKLK